MSEYFEREIEREGTTYLLLCFLNSSEQYHLMLVLEISFYICMEYEGLR
jgi:hypothetical protein